jgi:hypothetical protein
MLEMEESCEGLKEWFTTAPILTHFDPTKESIVETDASDFTLGAILSQKNEAGRLHPIAVHSRKFQPAEINYKVDDKELLAAVDCFKVWRRYLEGAQCTVMVFSVHQKLEYLTTTKALNRRHACWAQELAAYDFKIVYRPGSQNGKTDAFSRCPEYCPEKWGSDDQPITTILSEKDFLRENKEFIATTKQSEK